MKSWLEEHWHIYAIKLIQRNLRVVRSHFYTCDEIVVNHEPKQQVLVAMGTEARYYNSRFWCVLRVDDFIPNHNRNYRTLYIGNR